MELKSDRRSNVPTPQIASTVNEIATVRAISVQQFVGTTWHDTRAHRRDERQLGPEDGVSNSFQATVAHEQVHAPGKADRRRAHRPDHGADAVRQLRARRCGHTPVPEPWGLLPPRRLRRAVPLRRSSSCRQWFTTVTLAAALAAAALSAALFTAILAAALAAAGLSRDAANAETHLHHHHHHHHHHHRRHHHHHHPKCNRLWPAHACLGPGERVMCCLLCCRYVAVVHIMFRCVFCVFRIFVYF